MLFKKKYDSRKLWENPFKSFYLNTNFIQTDVITIERTGEFFRLLYDVKGRFVCHRVSAEESAVSICFFC